MWTSDISMQIAAFFLWTQSGDMQCVLKKTTAFQILFRSFTKLHLM